jgi:hypothetical protein
LVILQEFTENLMLLPSSTADVDLHALKNPLLQRFVLDVLFGKGTICYKNSKGLMDSQILRISSGDSGIMFGNEYMNV